MLTTGHIASSYILAQSANLFGYQPSAQETLLIIAAGVIIVDKQSVKNLNKPA